VASAPILARRATARITWPSKATGKGEEAELASCGLRREICPGIEQAEISRIRHLHNAMFHAFDGPTQGMFERLRRFEVEAFQLDAEFMYIARRRDRARLDALRRRLQLEVEPAADSLTVRSVRK
jgi:hypothetical protein